MSYSDLTINSPSRLKRWSHGLRFSTALNLGDLHDGEAVADYGTGDGYLLERAMATVMLGDVWAFEPIAADQARLRLGDRAHIVETPSELPDGRFDKVFCMEVIEHLPPAVRDEALINIRRILKPTGRAIITVPIEIGASSLFKNVARIAMGKPHEDTNASAVLWSALGVPSRIHRRETVPGYMASHIGFDYRELPRHLEHHGLGIVSRRFSPLPTVGPLLNSQVSYCVRKVWVR